MIVYTSSYTPLSQDGNLSLPQFISRYNPDGVSENKVIHIDTIKDKSITYGDLRRNASSCAAGLRFKLNLQVGNIVLCLAPNSTDLLLLTHSIWWAGATFSGISPASTPKDIAHALTLVKPTHICVYPEALERTAEALHLTAQSPRIVTILERCGDYPLFPDDLISTSNPLEPFDPASHGLTAQTALACINFSSGTTGPFKAVSLSHYGLIAALRTLRASVPSMTHADIREVVFMPYFHIMGMTVLLASVWLGQLIVGMHKFDLESFCWLIEKHRANRSYTVPPVAVALANSDVVAKYDVTSLERVMIGAAPIKKELQMMLKKRLGSKCKVMQGYGATECVITHHQIDGDEDIALGSVGKLLSGVEARIVDTTTGRDVEEIGQEGEMWLRTPTAMVGYYGNKEATNATLVEGGQWLRTGDIVYRDKLGYFWIVDRLKEMIKYKGYQVAPSELEGLLLQHERVVDAAVCSTYDDAQATELPVAYVALRPPLDSLQDQEKQSVLEDIRSWFDSQVISYKKLRGGIFHLQILPKNPTGKILRRELPAQVAARRQGKI